MAFTWKDKKDIWKGEGIYFLTFVVTGRQKLLGELVDIPHPPGRIDTRNYSVDVPLVVMMLDGFPQEGTEAARFFHPGGAYHQACGEGRLYLMAPHAENYNDPRLIALTEKELARKAEEKHQIYSPIPRTSTRWRMISGNVMLGIIGEV